MSGTNACALQDVRCIRDAAITFHAAVLKLAAELVGLDPQPGSLAGTILTKLATAIEAYEKVVYPIPPPPTPDPEQDFEGCVTSLVDKALKEIVEVPEAERQEWFVMKAASRLHRLKQLNAPLYIIEREKRVLQHRVAELPVYLDNYEPPEKGMI